MDQLNLLDFIGYSVPKITVKPEPVQKTRSAKGAKELQRRAASYYRELLGALKALEEAHEDVAMGGEMSWSDPYLYGLLVQHGQGGAPAIPDTLTAKERALLARFEELWLGKGVRA